MIMISGTYTCIEPFGVPRLDDNGSMMDNKQIVVEKESIWHRIEKETRFVGNDDSIYLENSSGLWIEITSERFENCFQKVKNDA